MNLTAKQKVIDFAGKFSYQLVNYFSKGPLPEANEALQNRLKKASAYFTQQFKDVLLPACFNFQVLTDNKNVRKNLEEKLTDLRKALFIKNACFVSCKDGFKASIFTKTKADADLDFLQVKKTAFKPSVIPKDLEHPELYQKLLLWRKEQAKVQQKEAHSILPTSTMIEIAKVLPSSSESLKRIGKLGNKRIKESGAAILEIIDAYCSEKGIQTDLLQFASLKAKPDTKKISFEAFQAGKTIKEIAEARELKEGTIQSHLGHYVGLGQLDILKIMPQEKVDKILKYYSENDSDGLNDAKAHFGEAAYIRRLENGVSILAVSYNHKKAPQSRRRV